MGCRGRLAEACKRSKPVGEINTSRIVVNALHVEHWLNGAKVLEYDLDGDEVFFRNITIREWPSS